MRKIKFRAWDGLNKKFTYWTMNDLCTWDTKGEKPSALEDWQQFTGLLDKNGKEIFEGDILSSPKDYKGPVSVVKWKDDGAYFHVFRGETSSGYTLQGEVSRAEIIGNIYQNPELLNI